MRKLIPLVALSLALGCGSVVLSPDSGSPDARSLDASVIPDADPARPDAPVQPPVDGTPAGSRNRELSPAAGTVTGGGYKVDFQLGHWGSQKKVTGGGYSTEGAASVKP